jgi:hypothetical protein
MEVTDPTLLEDQLFRNFFVYTKQDTDNMVATYRSIRSESEALIALIEERLGD